MAGIRCTARAQMVLTADVSIVEKADIDCPIEHIQSRYILKQRLRVLRIRLFGGSVTNAYLFGCIRVCRFLLITILDVAMHGGGKSSRVSLWRSPVFDLLLLHSFEPNTVRAVRNV